MSKQKYNSLEDGFTHINIYSRGNTRLGRLLSNFSFSEFTHPKYGKFNSVEGFWYYIKLLENNDVRKEALRTLYGFSAKQLGRQLENDLSPKRNPEFITLVKEAITLKIEQSEEIQNLLIESHLPFTHYYVTISKLITPNNVEWVIKHIEEIRFNLKNKGNTL